MNRDAMERAAVRWTEFAFLSAVTLGIGLVDLYVLLVTCLLISYGDGPSYAYAILVCKALVIPCIIVSYWWCEWAVVGRRHLLSGCLRDCSSEVGRVWRATLGWRFCLSEFALIFGGIYWSNPIWIVIGVAAWLIALGLGFQDTGPLPPNDALSRLSELVQLALSFLLLSGLMAAGSIYLTTMKLPEWNITYSQQQFGLAEMLVGTPMAVLLLLLLIILGTASFLARNGQALLPREKRWKCARRISPAAITLIGACYLTVGFYNLMTTPELHDPHPGCSLNGLDYLALAPFGQVLKDKSCHSE